jgi:hypothetical protein
MGLPIIILERLSMSDPRIIVRFQILPSVGPRSRILLACKPHLFANFLVFSILHAEHFGRRDLLLVYLYFLVPIFAFFFLLVLSIFNCPFEVTFLPISHSFNSSQLYFFILRKISVFTFQRNFIIFNLFFPGTPPWICKGCQRNRHVLI